MPQLIRLKRTKKLTSGQHLSPLQVKCDQYWPTRGTDTYGLIQVTLLDTVELATYCVRTFALFKVRSFCPHTLRRV